MKAIYVCTISKAKKAAFVIWISSLLLASPTLVVQVHMEVGHRVKAFWCVRNFDAPLLWRGYETYMLVLVLLVPACVMAAAYAAICASVVSMVGQRRSMTGKGQMKSAEVSANGGGGIAQAPAHPEDKTIRQVVPMLIVVVVLFIICWGPLLILNMLTAHDIVPNISVSTKYARTVLDLLSYFNSCMNPVVYGFMSRNFRKGFKRALCNLARRDDGNQSLSHSHHARPAAARDVARLETLNGANAAKLSLQWKGLDHDPRRCSSRRQEYGRFGHTPTRDSAKAEFESCHMSRTPPAAKPSIRHRVCAAAVLAPSELRQCGSLAADTMKGKYILFSLSSTRSSDMVSGAGYSLQWNRYSGIFPQEYNPNGDYKQIVLNNTSYDQADYDTIY
ncbi:pyroglutamylated RF-amide peptide receptor-like [Penaeus chinensis]|uniref:pyroglutamylated RF-amide peptide receptor-like n=1 Tax=Penaeus chinensis TaxID=139456 RepID=UPI001FB60AAE|nr:pyroglutamylated RF-amide peptide receptor-like [Penaeus chinensis]